MTSTNTMPGVIHESHGKTGITWRPVPEPGPREVLVRIAATGICGTDRGIVLGEFPSAPGCILGHEAAGIVARIGPAVTRTSPGDRVVVNPTSFCSVCCQCLRGKPEFCTEKNGREIGVDCDGTMTEFLAIDERYVHPLLDGFGFRAAAVVEPLACVLNNLRCASVREGDRVVIQGAGPIGTLCANVLNSRGTRVTLVEPDRERAGLAHRILAAGRRGGTFGVTGDAAEAGRAEIVIDTTGRELETALSIVENGGTVIEMGEREHARASMELRPLVTCGVSVRGAGPYRPSDFAAALRLAPLLELENLVTHTVPLERHRDAFGLLGGPGTGGYEAMKVLVSSDPALVA